MFIPAVMKPSWFTLQIYEKRKKIFHGSVWAILLLLSVLACKHVMECKFIRAGLDIQIGAKQTTH